MAASAQTALDADKASTFGMAMADFRITLPAGQFVQAVLVPALPVLAVFGAMVMLGQLDPVLAAVYGVALAGIGAFIAVRHVRELWRVVGFADQLKSASDASLPRPGSSFIAVELVHAISRLHRDLMAERQRLVAEAVASDEIGRASCRERV